MADPFVSGSRVVLVPTSQMGKFEPKEIHGRVGTFLGIAKTGYARVQFDGRPVPELVHPESLQEVKP
jgi:hypothetical protein